MIIYTDTSIDHVTIRESAIHFIMVVEKGRCYICDKAVVHNYNIEGIYFYTYITPTLKFTVCRFIRYYRGAGLTYDVVGLLKY